MKNILILDSEEIFLELFSNILKENLQIPFNIQSTMDGDEALLILLNSKTPFDLFVTDIMHTGNSCFELIEIIRKKFPVTKIVIASAAGGYYTEEQLSLADVYLPKPFNISSTFLKIIKCLLNLPTH